MKKLYLGVAFALVSGGLVAQSIPLENSAEVMYSNTLKTVERPATIHQDRAAGDIIWSNDFSNAAEWTPDGPSTNYETNGWSIGSSTTGWYFGTNNDMGTTGEFARFVNGDPNVTGSVIENGPFTLEYTGTIDLTGIPAPHLEFEHYGARFITIQAVEISTDGGNSWVQAANNNDLVATTDVVTNIYPRPDTRRFNISEAIAPDPSNVKIRLFWDGDMNGPAMNYIEYGWFVDDIRIVEGHPYDTKLLTTNFRAGVAGNVLPGGLEYGQIPLSQASDLTFIGKIESNGGNIQSGSYLDIEVVRDGSNSVYTGTSPVVNIGVGMEDSLVASTTYKPDATGNYEITFEALQTNPDGNPADNTNTMSFEVTDHLYGRDNQIMGGGFSNFASNNDDQVIIGNSMEIFETGVCSSIEVVVTTSPDNVGQLIYGRVYKYIDQQTGFIEIAITDDYEITAADLGVDNPITLYLEEHPIDVIAGEELLVAVGHYGGNPGVVFGSGQPVQQGSVLGYTSSQTLTSLIDPEAIMVRLNMIDITGVEDQISAGPSVMQNIPNPFSDQTLITYNLNESSPVSMEIVDVSGKVAFKLDEGIRAAGQHSIQISADQLSNGIYFYTFRAGDYQETKRMVVNR